MPLFRSGFQSEANAIWSLVPLASRTVTASTVSDKTGYSLTTGSYSVLASSVQRGTVAVADGVATGSTSVSNVTTTRTRVAFLGARTNGANAMSGQVTIEFSSNNIDLTRATSNGGTTAAFEVMELT